ncbi:relaxase/mobilization nuclease domain-containing protein [Flavobacterium johnsoniae]|uniref:Relaxase/Mobilisation nuclease domain-containing protein n=1 Tax=Flavobacterium johnsoniae TaxID=986 RepID=A0A1M5V879_FLAJO|nr:relaxase/mobilization nuclease domain-containing protein [Flavobacterium johnsoniae]SHH71425.1 Relaxase/Mobilisation nuclease domain-containing protein [Flavobacterium johnsoniae]
MVAVIKTGHCVRAVFNYNENKVKQAKAQCIGEGNYPMEVSRINLSMKLSRLLHQNALNENVKRNSVHISLNFHPSENYSKEKLLQIAAAYMEKIGFAQQPYLVYQHHDAGHPHIHLVSIKVREDGSRIDMQNIGRNQSEKARKEIEKEFNLVRAEGNKKQETPLLKPVAAGKVLYGKTESKRALSGVLESVLLNYTYGSLAELNAVLQLYNIKADRGSVDSRIFKSGGLVYRILDQEGKATGVPIKASDLYLRPTLGFLERRFALNSTERIFEKKRIRSAVDRIFFAKQVRFDKLMLLLEKEGINMVLRKSDAGLVYGLTYVDHVTRSVFNGSALGRNYSAKAVLDRCAASGGKEKSQAAGEVLKNKPDLSEKQFSQNTIQGISTKELEELTRPEWQGEYSSGKFKARRRKRKRKRRSDLN